MNKFKVGDICVIQRVTQAINEKFIGEEVTVVEVPKYPDGNYVIDGIPGWPWAKEYSLRLRDENGPTRGDMDKAISWDECSWRPKELVS